MRNSKNNHEPVNDLDMDASAAAQLLDAAEHASVRVNEGTDFRAHALIQGWGAAVLFIYVAAFLLLFTTPGHDAGGGGSAPAAIYANTLLIGVLAQSQLLQGARNRIPILFARPLRGWKLWLSLIGLIPFLAVVIASIFGVEFPWWVSLVVAVCAAAPLAILSIGSAQKARRITARASLRLPHSPLSRTARVVTAGLGVYFGVAGAVTVAPSLWFSIASLLLVLILVVLMIGWNARWGLPRVGSEWGQRQWVAMIASFALLVAMTLLAAKTSWDTPWLGGIGGVLIALPLVFSALSIRRQQ